jgi:hypothetical protein
MNTRIISPRALAGIVCLALSAVFSPSAFARSHCDRPQGVAERLACEKVKEGPTPLRLFIQRSQSVYGLYFYDFAQLDDDAWWTTGKAERVPAEKPKVARAPQAKPALQN